jgi:hypothetical protein
MSKNSSNYIVMPIYLKKNQKEALKDVKADILKDYGISIPMTEIMRDSIDQFMLKQGKDIKGYIKSKGF